MKKILFAALAAASLNASADGYVLNGIAYGNVCRNGAYFSIIPFAPVGAMCWNYGFGMYGVVYTN